MSKRQRQIYQHVIQYDMEMERTRYSEETIDNSHGTTTMECTSGSALPVSSEALKTHAKKKYYRKRESETSEEREQHNQKRRAKYKEQVLHPLPLSSETRATLAKEKYHRKRASETDEHRDQPNKNRREKYMAQVLPSKSLHELNMYTI